MSAVKERSIRCTAAEVRAILDGRKTQLRRVVKPQPGGGVDGCFHRPDGRWIWVICGLPFRCPYGQPGDRLWVRETHAFVNPQELGGTIVTCNNPLTWPGHPMDYVDGARETGVLYRASDEPGDYCIFEDHFRWRPSVHMPRWASRITLEISGVCVELDGDEWVWGVAVKKAMRQSAEPQTDKEQTE